jgi:hypothetical protein
VGFLFFCFWTGHQHPELIVSKQKHFLQRAHQICMQNTHFYSDLIWEESYVFAL